MQANVKFAGYRMPHPLDHMFELKVQSDGSVTPIAATQQTVDGLIGQLAVLEDRLRAEVRRAKSANRSSIFTR